MGLTAWLPDHLQADITRENVFGRLFETCEIVKCAYQFCPNKKCLSFFNILKHLKVYVRNDKDIITIAQFQCSTCNNDVHFIYEPELRCFEHISDSE